MGKKMDTATFIAKAKEIHGNKYDYSKVVYRTIFDNVIIICPKHGEFLQIPQSHLKGCGCKLCSRIDAREKSKKTKEEFINQANALHNGKYDYSLVNYVNSKTPVRIICREHGEFLKTPNAHLVGQGCPKCSNKHSYDTESFIEEAKKVHGDRYDYSLVNYVNSTTPVRIICREHGEFLMAPTSHLHKGSNCPRCAKSFKYDTKTFIEEAKKKHGDRYDYSLVNYVNSTTPVRIICREHGEFLQKPTAHLHGHNCPECMGHVKWTKEKFIEEAKKVHGDKYDYSKFDIINAKTPSIIICKEHGEFTQSIISHLRSAGCPKCSGHYRKTLDDFIAEAQIVHDNKYDYSKITNYKNGLEKVLIGCPIHGYFWQTPKMHIAGSGCPKCAPNMKLTRDIFIERAKKIHGDRYDYSKVNYVNGDTKVTIICKDHGEFEQTPHCHLNGQGCPKCAKFTSEYQLELLECGDLQHMSAHQLIELIAAGKLPKAFNVLALTPSESDERLGKINELKNILTDEAISADEQDAKLNKIADDSESELQNQQDVSSLPTILDGSNNDDNASTNDGNQQRALPSTVMSNINIHDNLVCIEPTGEAGKFMVAEDLYKIWRAVLDVAEEDRYAKTNILNSEIERIERMEGGKFFTYVKQLFLSEYRDVTSIKEDAEYSFPYPLMLMQKLTAYRMMHNKSFGNWCDAGAGKTNSFLFSTRRLQTHINLVIAPNDVLDSWVNAIKDIYPNSNIVVPSKPEDIVSYSEREYTYILMNYEKFQSNNGASEYIKRLYDTNTLNFICLDEVQYAKVRYVNNASSRSQQLNDLITKGRVLNPEMRVLAMTATPCINNLTEVRSIVELLTGKVYDEIDKGRISFETIHNAYKALMLNGIRYIPKYPITIDEVVDEIDCTGDEELYAKLLDVNSADILAIDTILAQKKLEYIHGKITKGSIIYTSWVSEMSPMIMDAVRTWGYTVETYNGESGDVKTRKEILERFKSGKTDVLIASDVIVTGVNGLQKMCNKMFLATLPWTDAGYRQLKGRLYRTGSIFDKIHFYIPQVCLTVDGKKWSWDKYRKSKIDQKKCLATAILDCDGIQNGYNINMEKLAKMAMDALKKGLHDFEPTRAIFTSDISEVSAERKFGESFVNDIHQKANTSNSSTTHTAFTENPDKEKEYHRQREILKSHWIEDPVDRVADMIKSMSSKYTRIIDMGCGMNKLSKVVDSGRVVTGVNHTNVSGDGNVIAADMVDLHEHISDSSMDIAIYCLSLWGKNYMEYFQEAYRILDVDGRMIIVEPADKFGENERYGSIDSFVENIENCGFERLGRPEHRNNFVYFKFSK